MFIRARERGFTLIELLVVIAIIGLLSSVVLASLNSARERARDARRMSDIIQIRTALESYYAATGSYPSEAAYDTSRGSGSGGLPSGTTWSTTSYIYQALVPAYIPMLPADPVNDTFYYYYYNYEPNVGGSDYCIRARLERNQTAFIRKGGPNPVNC